MSIAFDPSVGYRVLEHGQYVFREHETGQFAFVVTAGEIEIVKTAGSREAVLRVVGPGGMFGEMALISDKPRMASARVISEDAELMVITRELIERKLEGLDPFTLALVNVLEDHVRTTAAALDREFRVS